MRDEGGRSRGVVVAVQAGWAILVASVLLTATGLLEAVALVGPALGVLQPVALVVLAGLLVAAVSWPRPLLRTDASEPRQVGEPAWPEWRASWSVGRAPAIGAIHGRDGPGSRARRP